MPSIEIQSFFYDLIHCKDKVLTVFNQWDEKYDALISWNDPGEDPKNGSLLTTEYGDGVFVYTGISFSGSCFSFRWLSPA